MKRDVYIVLLCLAAGTVLGWFGRRWALRRAVRRKMRTLGMLAIVPILVPCVPTSGTAQQPADSLIGTTLSRGVIPSRWNGGDPITVYCITWSVERDDRPHVLVIVDAAPADTTQRPLCPDPRGGFYPLFIDGPICPPGQVSPFAEREYVLVRCGNGEVSRYRRPSPVIRRAP